MGNPKYRTLLIVVSLAAVSISAAGWTTTKAEFGNLISPQSSDSGLLHLFVETDRDVYRPGEIVTMVAILVNEGDKGFNATFGCDILASLAVYNSSGFEVYHPSDICILLRIVKIWIPPYSRTELRRVSWDQTFQGRQVPPGLYSVVATTTFLMEDMSEPVSLKGMREVALGMPWTIHEACRPICKRP